MKNTIKLVLFLSLLFTGLTLVYANTFCDGYKSGYVAGHCYGHTYCIAPITPICPIPYLNEGEFIDGYNRGFIDGLNDR